MRTFLVILALALAGCAQVAAASVGSDVSGVYLGPDRACRLVLSRFDGSWIKADLSCIAFAGGQSNASVVLYAPRSCWPNTAAIPFVPQAPVDYLTISGYTASVVNVLVGNEAAVINGVGEAQAWTRIAYAPSAAPFSCGDTPPVQVWRDERVCRLTGRLCGN